MSAIDAILVSRLGLSSADLPDVCYADWYDDGVSPRSAAARAVRYAKGEDAF